MVTFFYLHSFNNNELLLRRGSCENNFSKIKNNVEFFVSETSKLISVDNNRVVLVGVQLGQVEPLLQSNLEKKIQELLATGFLTTG